MLKGRTASKRNLRRTDESNVGARKVLKRKSKFFHDTELAFTESPACFLLNTGHVL